MAKNNRKVRAYIENLSSYDSEDFLTSESLKTLVLKETPNAIEEAIKNKSNYATLFEINNSSYYMDLHKKDWVSALSSCLSDNVAKEDYVECARINALITKIQSKQSKSLKKIDANG